jgi:hypothetical protein
LFERGSLRAVAGNPILPPKVRMFAAQELQSSEVEIDSLDGVLPFATTCVRDGLNPSLAT